MSTSTPTRRYRAEERPSKRKRLSPLDSEPRGAFAAGANPSTPLRRATRKRPHSRVNSSQSKRKRSVATPSSCRKRRLSSHHDDENAPMFESKKFRVFKPDVEMEDAPTPVKQTPSKTPSKRKRKKILKDVLRAEKISRAALRNLSVNNAHAPPAHQPAPQPHNAAPAPHPSVRQHNTAPAPHTEHSAQTKCSHRRPNRRPSEDPVVLTGEEQVEEVDISQCSEAEKQKMHETEEVKQKPLLAHVMDDGRCLVRIVRADGAVDYYTLYPHSEARRYYDHDY